MTEVSVVIPWCNRAEIARSLPANAEWLRKAQPEVIIVSSACDPGSLREALTNCCYSRVRLLHIEGVEHFNKPECLNIGAFFSRGHFVFTLDADIILTGDFTEAALKAIAGFQRYATVKEVFELDRGVQMHSSDPHGAVVKRTNITRVAHENGRTACLEYSVDKYGTRTGVGLVLVKKEDFVAIQGLNSNLRGWGYEDTDFQFRLQLGLGLEGVSLGQAQHVSHPSGKTAALSHSRNIALAWSNYSRGDLAGTYKSDVDRLKEKVLEQTM